MNQQPTYLDLSGERFEVGYRLVGDVAAARRKAQAICVEQTVELPADLLPPGDITDHILGRLENLETLADDAYLATISYPVEITGFELTQLLNVIFGNSSIKPGIRVQTLRIPESLLRAFSGPRFGRSGLRDYLGVPDRPLLATALKPMGLSPAALAGMSYQLALGGIDIIKDDHGLADQGFCSFAERVELCAAAVARANAETGGRSVYMPNVTGPAGHIQSNARLAKSVGAGALIISPGLTGMDAMRRLADDDDLALPIMGHPAFLGSFVTSPENGIAHGVLFGQIMRLAGADATIYPNFGGRFSFSLRECQQIANATAEPLGALRRIFPTPGGGMSLERIPEMSAIYGPDVIYLIGGNLHRHEGDLVASARRFREEVEKANLVGKLS